MLIVASSACGEESSDTSSGAAAAATEASETQELNDRIADLEAAADAKKRQDAREKRRHARERRERVVQEAEAKPEPTQSSGNIVVPDLTGLDHQAAQDALQGEGLWNLDETDATGQGRLLLFDRNWEVVRTDPPAGSQVSAETSITIYSKKQGE